MKESRMQKIPNNNQREEHNDIDGESINIPSNGKRKLYFRAYHKSQNFRLERREEENLFFFKIKKNIIT